MRYLIALLACLCLVSAGPAMAGGSGQSLDHPGPASFSLLVARGMVPGHTVIHKFGQAGDLDGAEVGDVWDGATDTVAGFTKTLRYTYSTTADIDTVSSSSGSDTVSIEIQGLDENWDLVTQNATLAGTAHVTLDTSLIRVFRMKNVGDTALIGNVFCYLEGTTTTPGIPDTEADVRAIIQIGNEQTLMALYTIPNGKTGFMTDFWMSAAKQQTQISNTQLFMRKNPTGVFQLKHESSMQSSGNGHIQHGFAVPLNGLPEMTDVAMVADSSAANGVVSAGFDIILIDD